MALHPLKAALGAIDLERPTAKALSRLVEAAAADGVTPAEQEILRNVRDRFAAGWSAAQRDTFDRALAAAPAGPLGVRTSARGPAPEGLASRMKTVWMGIGVDDYLQETFVADMARLGADLGFNLVLHAPVWMPTAAIAVGLSRASGLPVEALDRVVDVVHAGDHVPVWGEDNKVLLAGPEREAGTIQVLVPPTIKQEALQMAQAFTATEGYHQHHGMFQGAVNVRGEGLAAQKLAREDGRKVVRARGYLEGGNVLASVTPDGKPYALVGRDSVVISAFHLDQAGYFTPEAVAKQKDDLQATGALTPEVVEATAHKLLAAEQRVGKRVRGVSAALRARAADLLAKLALTEGVLARDLRLPADRLVVVTQPDFHIDMHMRPLAAGEVMVQHPAACMQLLDEALKEPRLPEWERRELRQMKRAAKAELETMGPVYDRILDELNTAGLIAIPTPGVFESERRRANFMNAVPGTNEAGVRYYLTNASSLGSLQRAFARFVKKLGVDRVEFLAGAQGGPRSLSVAEQSLAAMGGLDCREVDHGGVRVPTDDLTRAVAAEA